MQELRDGDARQVGPFVLVGRLGSGGMGAVYLGRSAGGRTVAVKVVRPDLAEDPAFRERFRHEVTAARRVSGAFTAPVVDADPDADVPWMATAFVVGVSLHQAVTRRGPLPEDSLWTLTAGLAEALTEVHGAGLIHRDLKPANVMLALDGPHVIDFGISRAADGTALTATGAAIGSAPYMSPEQALGRPLTPASDLFSLASTVVFAASGQNLFGEGAPAAVMFRIVHTPPDLGAVPAGLRPLLQACLEQDPAARPTPHQVVEYVERADRPAPSGGWLPDPVAADVVAVRAVLTALPAPSPTRRLLPRAPDHQPRSGPSRRKLILGLTAGALGAAGAVGAALTLGDGTAGDTSGQGKSGGGAAKGAVAVDRPSADSAPEALLAWKVNLPATCPDVLSIGGLVVCVSLEQIQGIDDKGQTKWTLNGPQNGLTFAMAPMPRTVVMADGDTLYTVGQSFGGPAGPGGTGGAALAAISLTDGTFRWKTSLDRAGTLGTYKICGISGGRASVITVGDSRTAGFGVWNIDLASHRTAWFQQADTTVVFSAVPRTGDRTVISDLSRIKAFDGRGEVVWTQDVATGAMTAAGRYLVVADSGSTMAAFDQTTGAKAWTVPGAVPSSQRGEGLATDRDGTALYALLKDRDGGASLAAVDPATGKPTWRAPLPPEPKDTADTGARLLHADGNVYRMGPDSVIWAFDASNGKPRWKFTGMKGRNPAELAWTAGDGRVCISDTGASTVAALHANGA
ncbi:PQQ-binding-like beta-propeller repeat protein [Streptomyces sp. NPDC006430]|uniref:serine/threonine-protein kinase n=1 Tax=Streptomyces sp. NPDC006430 TaxID=3154299 RepID=UPI0033A4C7E6